MDQMVGAQGLQQVKYSDQLILTTEQLADFYGTTAKRITDNFNENRQRFRNGEHYYHLEGDELREFKNETRNSGLVGYRASSINLWTKRGASRHSKMLGTDKAWDMFDELEENYFNPKVPVELTLDEQLGLIAQNSVKLNSRVTKLESNMRVNGNQERALQNAVNKRVMTILNGKDSYAYEKVGKFAFQQCWHDFKKYFVLPRYGELPQLKFDEGIQFIEAWLPDTEMRLRISNLNAQTGLFQ